MKILTLIVNYKKPLFDLDSIISLQQLSSKNRALIGIYLWDNSCQVSQEYQLETVGHGWLSKKYTNSIENHGLSYIYNTVITFALTESFDYILLLDNDSSFDNSFIDNILYSIDSHPSSQLFLPKVMQKDKIISPGRFISCKGYYVKNFESGIHDSKNVTAINSGMLIKTNYFTETSFRYDERILFYGVDDNFMINFSNFGFHFCLLDYCFQHKLSKFDNSESIKLKKWRFNDLVNGLRYNFKDGPVWTAKLVLPIYIWYLKIRFYMSMLI